MTVRIIHGDCQKVLPTLAAGSVDLVLTDPPYGETSLQWDRWPTGWMAGLQRVMTPGASLWIFGSQRMFIERAAEFSGWQFAQDLVWEKHNGSNSFADRFRRVHEHAIQLYPASRQWSEVYKQPIFTSDATARTVRRKRRPPQWGEIGAHAYQSEDGGPRLMRSVMCARSEHGRALHPTQKPVACLLPIIEYSCPPGGLVLDVFGGSGSTAIAARQLGRDALVIEADQDFISVIERRLANDAPLLTAIAS